MPERNPVLDALIREVEAKAAQRPDTVAILAAVLKLVIASEADPYLLSGALIEGVATTILQRVPEERRAEVAVEAVRLLRDRFRSHGII